MQSQTQRTSEAKRTLVLFALPLLILGVVPANRLYQEQVKQRQKQRLTRELVEYAQRHDCMAGRDCYNKEIKSLLQQGADANVKMPNGESMIRFFARQHFLDIVQHLKRAGAHPDAQVDRLIWRAYKEDLGHQLAYALDANDIPHLRKVVARGVDLNRRDRIYGTPLSGAIESRKVHIAAALLAVGANPRALYDGDSYLSLVLRHSKHHNGALPILRLLKQAGAPTTSTIEMFIAVIEDRPRDVEKYLRMGIDINATNNGATDNWTPLMWAASRGNARMVRLLLRRGANPKFRNAFGATALTLAYDGQGPMSNFKPSKFPQTIALLKRATRS